MNIEGIRGWVCGHCRRENRSRVVVCPCGLTHRPTEFAVAEMARLRAQIFWLNFWLVFAVAVAVAAVGIGLALAEVVLWPGMRGPQKGAEGHSARGEAPLAGSASLTTGQGVVGTRPFGCAQGVVGTTEGVS